jgi:hypothetical protein
MKPPTMVPTQVLDGMCRCPLGRWAAR